jgi:hypothetical protein
MIDDEGYGCHFTYILLRSCRFNPNIVTLYTVLSHSLAELHITLNTRIVYSQHDAYAVCILLLGYLFNCNSASNLRV